MDKKIKSFSQVCKECHKLQKKGKKVVFVHGFFDILHKGHVILLTEAKKLGDTLVVGVDHDENARRLKASKRPVNNHIARIFVLSHIESVDYVFLIEGFREKDSLTKFYSRKYYKKLMPNVVASCIPTGKYGNLKKKQAEKIGAKFVNIDSVYKKNTSYVIKYFGLE